RYYEEALDLIVLERFGFVVAFKEAMIFTFIHGIPGFLRRRDSGDPNFRIVVINAHVVFKSWHAFVFSSFFHGFFAREIALRSVKSMEDFQVVGLIAGNGIELVNLAFWQVLTINAVANGGGWRLSAGY